jgi:hypothetical protein
LKKEKSLKGKRQSTGNAVSAVMCIKALNRRKNALAAGIPKNIMSRSASVSGMTASIAAKKPIEKRS